MDVQFDILIFLDETLSKFTQKKNNFGRQTRTVENKKTGNASGCLVKATVLVNPDCMGNHYTSGCQVQQAYLNQAVLKDKQVRSNAIGK